MDSDQWKTWGHRRLAGPIAGPGEPPRPGTLTLPKPPLLKDGRRGNHLDLARQWLSEKQVEEFVTGRGLVKRWEKISGKNHWFDALYAACAAGNFGGVDLLPWLVEAVEKLREPQGGFTTPDGRPFLVTER
jgi:hypothetical protein